MRIPWLFLPLALWAAPPQTVLVSSGQTLYKSYCASCHGVDGKGGGPAAQALVMRSSNLCRLAIQNGGKFPVYRVVKMLGGADEVVAHGGKQMPVWGPAFREKAPKDREMADRVRNLVAFLESIQERPSK